MQATALLNTAPLDALTDNEVRIFETPRGRLMVEAFHATVSVDELFADGGLRSAGSTNALSNATAAAPPATARGVTDTPKSVPAKGGKGGSGAGSKPVSGSKGGSGKPRKGLTKEEEARQVLLDGEEVVRVAVAGIRRQLQLGLGLVRCVAERNREYVGSHLDALLPLTLPLARKRMLAESSQNDPSAAEPGAFAAVEALASAHLLCCFVHSRLCCCVHSHLCCFVHSHLCCFAHSHLCCFVRVLLAVLRSAPLRVTVLRDCSPVLERAASRGTAS